MDKTEPLKTGDNSVSAKRSRAEQRAREAAQRVAQARQKLLMILIGIALVINALLAFWLHGTLVENVERERVNQLRVEETQARVDRVQQYLNELRQTLGQAVEHAEQALAPEMARETLEELERNLTGLFTNPLAVRVIPVGTASLDRDHAVPIRFAELDLIRRTERREPALPEMVRVEDNWHLHLSAPLPASAELPVWGTLLVTLDNSELERRFGRGDTSMGQAQLLQKFDGASPLVLTQTGTGQAADSLERPVRNSHWHVRFTPSATLMAHAEEPPTRWILVLCVTSLISLIAAWVLSRVLVRSTPVSAAAEVVSEYQDTEEVLNTIKAMSHQQDVLDIAVVDGDKDILGLQQAAGKRAEAEPPSAKAGAAPEVPAGIFRSYDIRGLANSEITPELAEHIGQAVGSEALDQGDSMVIVARDGRVHSPLLCEHLIKGITRSGCQVIDIGVVPTPVLYFATFHLDETSSGVMVTASHNPAEYNGFKIVINGATLADEAVLDIRGRIQRQHYHRGQGSVEHRDIVPAYIDRIFSDVALTGQVSLVVDAGNAVTGVLAPRLFEELGCDVTPLYCELDGAFPNHEPDPTREENLRDLIAKVQEVNADMGVAFDGDGDRLTVVTSTGQIIWPDQLLMLFAKDILARHPGADVIFDVKCSRQLNQLITSYGGRPIMWKTGHSPMKSKMIETGALLGGEYSGHIFIKDRWYGFDDGMYAMARLLEIITLRDQKIEEVFAGFPLLPATPELKIKVPEDAKFALVERLVAEGDFSPGKHTVIDGLRVDFAKGWGLVRASNTSPALTLRFEAETDEALREIQQLFKRELLKIDSQLSIDF